MINGIFSGAVCYLLVAIAFPRISIKTSQTTRQESTPPLTIQIISVFFSFQAKKIHSRWETSNKCSNCQLHSPRSCRGMKHKGLDFSMVFFFCLFVYGDNFWSLSIHLIKANRDTCSWIWWPFRAVTEPKTLMALTIICLFNQQETMSAAKQKNHWTINSESVSNCGWVPLHISVYLTWILVCPMNHRNNSKKLRFVMSPNAP